LTRVASAVLRNFCRLKTATVKKHVARILEKLGVENRTAAALKGNGLSGSFAR
jgi:ATP/maltotriose-dependent transcriptional regulator MalT